MWEIVFFTMDLFFEIRWEIRPFYDLTISDFIRLKKQGKKRNNFTFLEGRVYLALKKTNFGLVKVFQTFKEVFCIGEEDSVVDRNLSSNPLLSERTRELPLTMAYRRKIK